MSESNHIEYIEKRFFRPEGRPAKNTARMYGQHKSLLNWGFVPVAVVDMIDHKDENAGIYYRRQEKTGRVQMYRLTFGGAAELLPQ